MQTIKPGTLAAGTAKSVFKGTIQSFIAKINAFSFMSSVKGTPAYWNQFLYYVIAVVNQLGIPTYFLTSSCGDLRWKELPYIFKKLGTKKFKLSGTV